MKTSIKNLKSIKISSLYFDGKPKVTWNAERLISDDGEHLVFSNSAPFKCLDKGRERELPFQIDQYFWRNRWFNILTLINKDGSLSSWYCNIATPVKFNKEKLTFTDLDLDLLVSSNGKYKVLDKDKFEANKEKYSYPPNIISAAENSLGILIKMVKNKEYPFNRFLV